MITAVFLTQVPGCISMKLYIGQEMPSVVTC
jgi:hypothetical protein